MTKYNKITPEIAEKLQAIVGTKRFFAKDAVKDDFSHDEMPIYGKYYPEVVCEVESTEEVSQIMRLCYENNIPVTPRGAGTGLVGGCVPLCGGVVLCTTRMNKILSYDMNNLVVHIQPGVLLCDLAADALTRGLMYPPDPGEKTATVGGNVCNDRCSARRQSYGSGQDRLQNKLGLQFAAPDDRLGRHARHYNRAYAQAYSQAEHGREPHSPLCRRRNGNRLRSSDKACKPRSAVDRTHGARHR